MRIRQHANCSKKAQMKIQQMAFMIVAVVIFFSMVGLIYVTLTVNKNRSDATQLQDKEALEVARKLSASPEFAFTASSDCASCIDLDRVIYLPEERSYQTFWNLEYLAIEIIYPKYSVQECDLNSYKSKNCNKIVIIPKSGNVAAKPAFVTLARYDSSIGGYRYELGKIQASAKSPK